LSRECDTGQHGETHQNHMKNQNENGQGDSALRELFFEAMKLAAGAIALAEDYSGGESETAQYLAREYDKINSRFDLAIDRRNAMHNAIVRAKCDKWVRESGHHYGYAQPIRLGLTMQG